MRRTPLCALILVSTLCGLFGTKPARADDDAVDPDEALRKELVALVREPNLRGALARANAALATRTDSVVALQYRAYALHRLGYETSAKKAYRKTVSLDPANAWAWSNLGDLLTTLGEWKEAVAAGRRAVELEPRSNAIRRRLTKTHRERGAWNEAAVVVRDGLTHGIDAAWSHAELGYLEWVVGHLDESARQWKLAADAGHDSTAVAHGRQLVKWDRPAVSSTSARRQGAGEPWRFAIGELEIETRVGPKLPADVTRRLLDFNTRTAKFLGTTGRWPDSVALTIHLSRTLEAHEFHRRREFPRGHRGRAFLSRRPKRGGGRRRWGTRGWDLHVYVAWSEPGLERGLSHEIAHVLLHVRTPEITSAPVWLDEGLATYLELATDAKGRLVSRSARTDLLETLAAGQSAGRLMTLREMLVAQRWRFEDGAARVRYAHAWAMVHYLVEGTGDGARKRFLAYLDDMGGPPSRARRVFERAFGPIDEVESGWSRYVESISAGR